MALKPQTIKRAIAEANAEAKEIMSNCPVARVPRGPKSIASRFEWLTSVQRHRIRKDLSQGVAPRSLAIKYGVKTATIKRIGDQS